MYRERIITALDFLIGHFHFVGLERRPPEHKRIADDPSRPDIHFVGVTDGALDYFGGNVVGRPTHCPFLLVAELQFGGESEVPHLEIHIFVEEDVAHLEIPVDNPVAVHVLKRGHYLQHEIACLLDGELLPLLDHLAEGLVGAEFQHDVHVLGVLEHAVELHDVLVVEGLVDLYLRQQLWIASGSYLLLCSALLQGCLIDYFYRIHLLRLQVHSFVALGKPTYKYHMRVYLCLGVCPWSISCIRSLHLLS